MSYEAAIQQDAAVDQRVSENLSQPPVEIDLGKAEPASAAITATLPDSAPAENAPGETVIRASLPGETRSLFAEADAGVGALDLRGANVPTPDVPPLQPSAGAQALAKPEPVEDALSGPLPEVLALPILRDRPVPVDGVPLPPRRPVGLAALPAPTQVASLVPVALPAASLSTVSAAPQAAVVPQPVEVPQPPVAPQALVAPKSPASPKAAAAPKAAVNPNSAVVAPQPAAVASSEAGFPNIANALAAVSASVGGANATLTPQTEAAPVFPEPTGGFKKGAQVFVRIFKREGALELWMKKGDRFALYKNYPICKWSGKLGPKQAVADYQSPEGFYSVSAKQLNPHSAYHLSFDVGYPNAYDRRHGFTGSKIMVHGDCKSVGCFAMTDAGIDDIYGFVASALANGQAEVPVHIFPFRMTEEAIARESGGGGSFLAFLDNGGPRQDWSPFWRNLKQGYDLFEHSHVPPTAYACGDRYEFSAAAGSCARIAGR